MRFAVLRGVRLAVLLLLASTGTALADDWSPVDEDGWPRGKSLEELRALRPCHFGEKLPGEGEPIPCRPELIIPRPQWALGVDWTTGLAAAKDLDLTGAAHAFGAQLDFGLTRWLMAGVRYEAMGVGTMTGAGVSHRFLGQARLRLFTDEVDRDAFVLTAGGGIALQEEEIGGTAPIVRAAISREVGSYLDERNALTAGLEVAYEQTLDDTELATLTVSARLGFEISIREPHNLGTRDGPGSARHWWDAAWWVGPAIGFEYTRGYALGGGFHAIATASYLFGRSEVTKQHGLDHGTQWAAQAGLHWVTGTPRLVPLYLQLEAGPAWIAETEGRRVAAVADAEIGFQLYGSCGMGAELGFRLRGEIDDGVDVTAGMMVLSIAVGGGLELRRDSCGGGGGGGGIVYMPTKPAPPPAPVVTETTTVTTTIPEVTVPEVDVGVEVEVKKPEPIVIEVELGAVIAGGLVQIDVDPNLLPLDRLRGTGVVDVELSGPKAVLLEYERKLRKELGGVELDAWANVATSGSVVRAKFTVWPPGSR